MKQAALNLFRVSGAFTISRLLNRHRALILTYHRFCADDDGPDTSASAFAEQLAYLKTHYRIVPLSRMIEQMNGRGELEPGLAAITIDDGYRDAYEIAFPLLRKHGLPATLFVVTEFVERRAWLWTDKMRYLVSMASMARPQDLAEVISGQGNRIRLDDEKSRSEAAEKINSELKNLSDEAKDEALDRMAATVGVTLPEIPPEKYAAIRWDEAREMDAHGVEIGSHTMTHPILTNVTDERLRRELSGSRTHLEAVLKRPVEQFCYPNGDYNERVRDEVIRAGYQCAVTCISGLNDSDEDLVTLRRIHTQQDLTHFMQSTSGFESMKERVRSAMKNTFDSSLPESSAG